MCGLPLAAAAVQGSEARNAELQQRLNLERFKYELLVDLVSVFLFLYL